MAKEFLVKKTLHIKLNEDLPLEFVAKCFDDDLDSEMGATHEVEDDNENIVIFEIEDGNVEVIDKQARLQDILKIQVQGQKTITVKDAPIEKKTQLEEFIIGELDPIFIDRFNVEFGSDAMFDDNKIVILAKHLRIGVPIKIAFEMPSTKHKILDQILKTVTETPELNTTALRDS